MELFTEFGQVESVKIITDKYNGRSKGFGFVAMDDSTEGKEAIDALNGKMVHDKELTVNEARPRKENY